jgi:signal transduction histidine kinase
MIAMFFGLKDTLLVISATIITVTITTGTSVIILHEQLLYVQLEPFLIISIIAVTFLVTISSIYRFYKYPERILPELKDVKFQAESGNINFDLSGKKILQDRFFGDILSILNNINTENQNNFSKLKILTDDLIQEKYKLKVILEAIPDAILVLNTSGHLLIANKKFNDLYNNLCIKKLPNEFNIYDLFGTHFIDEIIRLITSKNPEDRIIEFDKGFFFQPQIVHIFLPESNHPIGTMIELRDVTKYQEFEEIRKQFVSTVSHELRTPITGINLSINNIIKYQDMMSQSQFSETLLMIKSSSEILNRIIEDLLIISRIDSGKIDLEWKEFKLNSLVGESLNQLNPKSKEKNIKIITEIEKSIILRGDPLRISQIIRILLDNAIKYSLNDSIVYLSVTDNYKGDFNKHSIDGILIEIKDQGIGIREKDLPFLFERFFRSSNVVNLQGTGLGLSIAKDLIELHGGDIYVDSIYEKGTIFSIFIPTNKLEGQLN